MSYCSYVSNLPPEEENVHRHYHDYQYGFPLHDDNELFCRLVLEINQAGLSWTTILKKQEGFRRAYHNFDIPTVAAYTDADVARLLQDAGIIRNRLKVNAGLWRRQQFRGSPPALPLFRRPGLYRLQCGRMSGWMPARN